MARRRIIIIGAAGRDFHNFNTHYRNDPNAEVVAFTAAQIPDIAGRKYPAELAGPLYPQGIPIFAESDLPSLIQDLNVDECVFAYSDVPYAHVMKMSAIVNAAGASFTLLGPKDTQIKSTKPVIAVCAVRTGSGKSQTSRKIVQMLMARGLKVVAIRHPMPYGDLVKQKVQRYATVADLAKYECTIEEMEEYEPHVVRGNVIYAGVDYEAILRQAEQEADVILWDGGNNDFSFYVPDLTITVADPLRAGNEVSFYPGEVSLRTADVIVINKIDSASPENVQLVRENISRVNPNAMVIDAASPINVDKPELIKGKRVLCVEDGPTLTHGMMKLGAAVVAARKFQAAELVDPRPYVVGKLADTFRTYPNIGTLLPAMGYGEEQIHDLEQTINRTDCDTVVIGTPIDLNRVIKINKPTVKVGYELQEIGKPDLVDVLDAFCKKYNL
ncbi:MAG TPA: cyclic 2,3-diphosphoglycerate synthase [Spirochaetales bacterium]|nr:cyclic 2,3-diphosphoglycerate synthase [Spirochaetales bacterium]HPS14226.1 cyclic 2,3-diphosphoglycerate synthase [Spirochaetales bacterium]